MADPGVILINISLPSRLGEPCCAVESVRIRSFAGRPSIVALIVICASTLGAAGSLEGVSRSDLIDLTDAHSGESDFGAFTQAVRISKARPEVQLPAERVDISRGIENQKDKIAIEPRTSSPTRSSLHETVFFVGGMTPS